MKCVFLIFLGLAAFMVQPSEQKVNWDISVDITKIINYGLNKLDTMFSCAKYDGVRGAGCWHNNWEKRDLMCKRLSACWSRRWSYSHSLLGGRCYCCHCP
ncbi:hypothetical protein BOX15_Mlig001810g2 [Macrostomum lignano]|uniref:Uncharacterized protein n=1 Tax=Macrostomum lignano TaxID=282301 RepID=A0A267GXG9_9PLAT|nr:hypothetical protein BOX15_Mlig001810g5 [Macrostomum lignano]PAA54720.1 hypothetical protein BOX15_Mlig001810g6 [Macrostomum lignano]PAA90733.1 hypothetical protein BOX15_Mlig001810g3 [Macrostomum lignano]PAA90752.1 hypothetical protein BOX15_Mlig001810g2 [Macrostomum lignano]